MKQIRDYISRRQPVRGVCIGAAGRPASNQNVLTYVLTNNPTTLAVKFGAVDMGSGAFLEIGPGLPGDLGHALK